MTLRNQEAARILGQFGDIRPISAYPYSRCCNLGVAEVWWGTAGGWASPIAFTLHGSDRLTRFTDLVLLLPNLLCEVIVLPGYARAKAQRVVVPRTMNGAIHLGNDDLDDPRLPPLEDGVALSLLNAYLRDDEVAGGVLVDRINELAGPHAAWLKGEVPFDHSLLKRRPA